VGLVTAAAAFGRLSGFNDVMMLVVAGGLFLNHLIAKAGLFWVVGILGPKGSVAQPDGRKLPALFTTAFGLLILGLVGLPPLPAFWAKWQLIVQLVSGGHWIWIGMLLAGSLFEAVYLLRWFGTTVAVRRAATAQASGSLPALAGAGVGIGTDVAVGDKNGQVPAAAADATTASALQAPSNRFTASPRGMELDESESEGSPAKCGALIFAALALTVTGAVMTLLSGEFGLVQLLPLAAGVILFVLDFLPGKLKGLLSLGFIAYAAYLIVPTVSGVRWFFELLLLAGGGVVLIGSFARKGRQAGYYPLATMLVLSLGSVAAAVTALDFVFAWEVMALSSYLLVLRGDRTGLPSLRYAGFSVAGALLLMAGFAAIGSAVPSALAAGNGIAAGLTGGISIDHLLGIGGMATALSAANIVAPGLLLAAGIMVALGLLMKAGALGVHVWLPGAYGEAEDDSTALISSVMSKAALFAIVLLVGLLGLRVSAALTGGTAATAAAGSLAAAASLPEIVAWIGILTALFGALMAVFQEDVKYLMAYSSMSQLGYMIAGIGMMTHLGWTSSMFMAVNHLLYKGMLFLAIAGVIARTGTRSMYRMGGLIKKMPISYISALVGIIALSGVPPLPGFGGKWLFYTALIEKGWYLMAGIAFFASTVAFLYLFRFIHTVFLGQLKVRFQKLKEASIWLLIPQVILILGTIAIGAFPRLILDPIMNTVGGFFPETVHWENYTVVSTLGYWSGSLVMLVTMGVFLTPLVWLLLVSRRPQTVRQFNMVYAGERPDRPETTHYAHNFFQPYGRALGFLVKPVFVRFWNGVSEGVHSIAKAFDNLYSGNGQTYALHILLYVVVVYFIMRGSL